MNYFLVFFIFILSHSLVKGQESGLISNWKMDNSCELKDEIADAANGAMIDILPASDRNGESKALAFGSTPLSYITVGVAEKLKLTEDKTISFWILPESGSSGSVFSYGGNGINLGITENEINASIAGNSFFQLPLSLNTWQLVTITFTQNYSSSKSNCTGYINAIKIASAEMDKGNYDYTNSIASIGEGLKGDLDDLRIYNRVLTDEEILNLPLPVKLDSFTGKVLKNGSVELNWYTSTEENASHFDIQKSSDGINFKDIGRIQAGKYIYSYIDNIPASSPSPVFYRLRMVDTDGHSELSAIVKISAPNDSPGTGLLLISPNPVESYINTTRFSEFSDLSVLNSIGLTVKQFKIDGTGVNVSALTPGLYYIVLTGKDKKEVLKFIKK